MSDLPTVTLSPVRQLGGTGELADVDLTATWPDGRTVTVGLMLDAADADRNSGYHQLVPMAAATVRAWQDWAERRHDG